MSKKLKGLRDRLRDVQAAGEAAYTKVYGDPAKPPTAEEIEQVRALLDERDQITAEIEALEAEREAEQAFASRQVVDDPAPAPAPSGGDARHGFQNAGEFFLAVHAAGTKHDIDPRLRMGAAAASSFGNTATGADGAYLIPPEFSTRILELAFPDDDLIEMLDDIPITGNSMTLPADETTPWGSSGVRAYWRQESTAATQTKPNTKLKSMRLNELITLVPMTTELLDDATAAGPYVERRSAMAIRWKATDSLFNGSGAGQPVGVISSPGTVVQAKETSQTADTIVAANVAKMFSRCMLNPMSTVWSINHDAWPQLFLMTVGDRPVFIPPQTGVTGAPGGFLMGLPVRLQDSCQTLGDQGDIVLGNWGDGYVSIRKSIQTQTSIHLWFDQGIDAFRAIFRFDGQPWLSAPMTPPYSAVTRSHFVTLAARA